MADGNNREAQEAPSRKSALVLTAFRCGILHAVGGFDPADFSGEEQDEIGRMKSWFWLGEVIMAGLMAACIAVPAGIVFAERTSAPIAVIGGVLVFLPLLVFIPKIIRQMRAADTDAILAAAGSNEHLRKVFWTLFLAATGLVLAEIAGPATAQQIVAVLAGAG